MLMKYNISYYQCQYAHIKYHLSCEHQLHCMSLHGLNTCVSVSDVMSDSLLSPSKTVRRSIYLAVNNTMLIVWFHSSHRLLYDSVNG